MGRHSDDESGTGRLPAARAGRRHDGLGGSGPGDDGVGHDGFGFGANRDPRRRRRTWGVLAVVLVAMLVGALLVWRSAADSCGDGTVTVAADPAIAEAMTEIAKKAGDDSCYTFAVESVSGKDIPARLTGGDKPPDLWVADIVYLPIETELLRTARGRGHRTLDGGRMAIAQAADSIRLITGLSPDRERMRTHFLDLLRVPPRLGQLIP